MKIIVKIMVINFSLLFKYSVIGDGGEAKVIKMPNMRVVKSIVVWVKVAIKISNIKVNRTQKATNSKVDEDFERMKVADKKIAKIG